MEQVTYKKKNWIDDELITDVALNNIEIGINDAHAYISQLAKNDIEPHWIKVKVEENLIKFTIDPTDKKYYPLTTLSEIQRKRHALAMPNRESEVTLDKNCMFQECALYSNGVLVIMPYLDATDDLVWETYFKCSVDSMLGGEQIKFSGINLTLENIPTQLENGRTYLFHIVSYYSGYATKRETLVQCLTGIPTERQGDFRELKANETFTLDTSTPEIPNIQYGSIKLSTYSATLTEGTTTEFSVRLSRQPTQNQAVTLSCTNANVQITPKTFIFTPDDFAILKPFTVTIAHDSDRINDNAEVVFISDNTHQQVLRLTIKDDDVI